MYQKRNTISCNFPGNIEDLPMEKIPQEINLLPPYWQRPGVYGIYSSTSELQFVAASPNILASIGAHLKYVPNASEKVNSVRMITVDHEGDAPLDKFAEGWVMALHESELDLPPGNTDESPEWRIEPASANVYFSNGLIGADLDARVEEEIKGILRDHKVVLFMKGTRDSPKCGFSKAVVDVLDRGVGDDFVCVDCLDNNRNDGLRNGIKKFSNWPTIPQLYVDGDFVGGADIIQEMEMNGELAAVLNS